MPTLPQPQLQQHQAKAQEVTCNTSNEEITESLILPEKTQINPENAPVLPLNSNISNSYNEIQPQPIISLAHLILNPSSTVTSNNLNETLINENEKNSALSAKDLEQKIIQEKINNIHEADHDDDDEEDEKKSVNKNVAKTPIEENLSEKTNKRSKKKHKNSIPTSSSTDTSSELSQSQIDRLISAVSISTSGDSSLSQRNETTNSEQFLSPNNGDSNSGFYKSVYYDQYLDQDLEQANRNENEPISLEDEEDYLD